MQVFVTSYLSVCVLVLLVSTQGQTLCPDDTWTYHLLSYGDTYTNSANSPPEKTDMQSKSLTLVGDDGTVLPAEDIYAPGIPITPSDGSDIITGAYKGHYCYKLMNDKRTYLAAEAKCKEDAQSGHVMSVHSDAENEILRGKCPNSIGGECWVGFVDCRSWGGGKKNGCRDQGNKNNKDKKNGPWFGSDGSIGTGNQQGNKDSSRWVDRFEKWSDTLGDKQPDNAGLSGGQSCTICEQNCEKWKDDHCKSPTNRYVCKRPANLPPGTYRKNNPYGDECTLRRGPKQQAWEGKFFDKEYCPPGTYNDRYVNPFHDSNKNKCGKIEDVVGVGDYKKEPWCKNCT